MVSPDLGMTKSISEAIPFITRVRSVSNASAQMITSDSCVSSFDTTFDVKSLALDTKAAIFKRVWGHVAMEISSCDRAGVRFLSKGITRGCTRLAR